MTVCVPDMLAYVVVVGLLSRDLAVRVGEYLLSRLREPREPPQSAEGDTEGSDTGEAGSGSESR